MPGMAVPETQAAKRSLGEPSALPGNTRLMFLPSRGLK